MHLLTCYDWGVNCTVHAELSWSLWLFTVQLVQVRSWPWSIVLRGLKGNNRHPSNLLLFTFQNSCAMLRVFYQLRKLRKEMDDSQSWKALFHGQAVNQKDAQANLQAPTSYEISPIVPSRAPTFSGRPCIASDVCGYCSMQHMSSTALQTHAETQVGALLSCSTSAWRKTRRTETASRFWWVSILLWMIACTTVRLVGDYSL